MNSYDFSCDRDGAAQAKLRGLALGGGSPGQGLRLGDHSGHPPPRALRGWPPRWRIVVSISRAAGAQLRAAAYALTELKAAGFSDPALAEMSATIRQEARR